MTLLGQLLALSILVAVGAGITVFGSGRKRHAQAVRERVHAEERADEIAAERAKRRPGQAD